MDFNLSEEQTLIRDSIARFVSENYAFDQRNTVVAMEHGFSAEHWQQFAELGWLSIPFAEEHAGFGGGPVDTMVIMQEFGRGLVAEPYLATVMLFGGLLQAGASDWGMSMAASAYTFASCVYGPADPSGAMDLSPTGLPRAQIRDPHTPGAPSPTHYS